MTRVSDLFLEGNLADRPAAASVPDGCLFSSEDDGIIYKANDSAWVAWATLVSGGGGGGISGPFVRPVASSGLEVTSSDVDGGVILATDYLSGGFWPWYSVKVRIPDDADLQSAPADWMVVDASTGSGPVALADYADASLYVAGTGMTDPGADITFQVPADADHAVTFFTEVTTLTEGQQLTLLADVSNLTPASPPITKGVLAIGVPVTIENPEALGLPPGPMLSFATLTDLPHADGNFFTGPHVVATASYVAAQEAAQAMIDLYAQYGLVLTATDGPLALVVAATAIPLGSSFTSVFTYFVESDGNEWPLGIVGVPEPATPPVAPAARRVIHLDDAWFEANGTSEDDAFNATYVLDGVNDVYDTIIVDTESWGTLNFSFANQSDILFMIINAAHPIGNAMIVNLPQAGGSHASLISGGVALIMNSPVFDTPTVTSTGQLTRGVTTYYPSGSYVMEVMEQQRAIVWAQAMATAQIIGVMPIGQQPVADGDEFTLEILWPSSGTYEIGDDIFSSDYGSGSPVPKFCTTGPNPTTSPPGTRHIYTFRLYLSPDLSIRPHELVEISRSIGVPHFFPDPEA